MSNSIMSSTYTQGQVDFITFLQVNRNSLTVLNECQVSRKDLVEVLENSVYVAIPAWIAITQNRRAGRGYYLIPELNVDVSTLTVNDNKRGRKAGSPNVKGMKSAQNII